MLLSVTRKIRGPHLIRYSRNLVLLGDSAVGKTSLIRRYVIDKYDDKYISTIGKKITKKELILGTGANQNHVTLMIWDIIGQKGYKYMQSLSLMNAHGAILVSDLTRKKTLESLKSYWIPMVLKITGPIPLIFLGNKVDLVDELELGLEEIEKMAQSCKGFETTPKCYLTSARTGEKVENAFITIASQILSHKSTMKVGTPWSPMDKTEIESLQDVVDHIVADFSDQFGGIDNATPFIKHQIEISGLDLKNPNEVSVMQFIDRLANVERSFRPAEVVDENRTARLKLFKYRIS